MAWLVLTLIAANIANSTYQYSNYLFQSQTCLLPDQFNATAYKRGAIGVVLSSLICNTLFTLAYWLFANKYWVLSFRVQSLVENKPLKIKCQQRTNVITISNIVFWVCLINLLFFVLIFSNINQRVTLYNTIAVVQYISLFALIFIQAFSCFVIFDSFARLKKYSSIAGIQMNTFMQKIHALTYTLYIASLLPYFFLNFVALRSNGLSIVTILVSITQAVSQLLLIYLLNSLLKVPEKHVKSKKYGHQTPITGHYVEDEVDSSLDSEVEATYQGRSSYFKQMQTSFTNDDSKIAACLLIDNSRILSSQIQSQNITIDSTL